MSINWQKVTADNPLPEGNWKDGELAPTDSLRKKWYNVYTHDDQILSTTCPRHYARMCSEVLQFTHFCEITPPGEEEEEPFDLDAALKKTVPGVIEHLNRPVHAPCKSSECKICHSSDAYSEMSNEPLQTSLAAELRKSHMAETARLNKLLLETEKEASLALSKKLKETSPSALSYEDKFRWKTARKLLVAATETGKILDPDKCVQATDLLLFSLKKQKAEL